MANADTHAASDYHHGTKHSPESVRRSRHVLEWDIMPRPFKVYLNLEPIPLPRDFTVSTVPALAAIEAPAVGPAGLDRTTLARLLHFSAGVLRHRIYPGGGERFYRAAACTGALYHIDLYVVTGELRDLEAGVYHFSPHDFSLRLLRRGDYRGALVQASGGNPDVAAAPATLVSTSTFWRNAWKYRARAYRHCYWDDGTIIANLLAVAAAAGVKTSVALGFVDDEVNRLLDLDTAREVSLSLVALGEGDACAAPVPPIEPLGFETLPLSLTEVDYPEIRGMHTASSLATPAEVAAWRAAAEYGGRKELAASAEKSDRTSAGGSAPAPAAESIESVILRRGSARRFSRGPIRAEQLATILRAATSPVPSDFAAPSAALTDIYAIVLNVEGLTPGAYFYDRQRAALTLLRPGELRREAGFLSLGQELAQDAAVNLYWLADLRGILARRGNRGYRAAQLEGAIGGGRAYLASYAQRLGATGLTFFDDNVTEFFSPHAAGKSVMFLAAVGKSARG